MKSLNLEVSDSLAKQIQLKASELHTDVNDVVVKALEKFLFFSELESFRTKLSEKNNNTGWSSEEDLFNDIS